MVETTLEYRGAFSLPQEHDPAYTMTLSEGEWEWASSVTGMKLFVEVTNVFSGNKHPTANIYFPEMCDVHIQLIEWCKSPNGFISSMAMKMKMKFDKYWSKCSFGLAVAAILDPWFKMKFVKYYNPQIYTSDAPGHIKEVLMVLGSFLTSILWVQLHMIKDQHGVAAAYLVLVMVLGIG